MTIAEKVAYLKGLADGSNLNSESGEGKLLTAIIDTLEDIAYELEEMTENIEELDEALDAVSEDLEDVEELLFGDDDDDDCDCCCDDDEDCNCCDDDEDGCGCGCCEDGEMTYEVDCPSCGGEIVLQEADLVSGSIKCPACGEQLDFEYGEDEDSDAED